MLLQQTSKWGARSHRLPTTDWLLTTGPLTRVQLHENIVGLTEWPHPAGSSSGLLIYSRPDEKKTAKPKKSGETKVFRIIISTSTLARHSHTRCTKSAALKYLSSLQPEFCKFPYILSDIEQFISLINTFLTWEDELISNYLTEMKTCFSQIWELEPKNINTF